LTGAIVTLTKHRSDGILTERGGGISVLQLLRPLARHQSLNAEKYQFQWWHCIMLIAFLWLSMQGMELYP